MAGVARKLSALNSCASSDSISRRRASSFAHARARKSARWPAEAPMPRDRAARRPTSGQASSASFTHDNESIMQPSRENQAYRHTAVLGEPSSPGDDIQVTGTLATPLN